MLLVKAGKDVGLGVLVIRFQGGDIVIVTTLISATVRSMRQKQTVAPAWHRNH
jgi:hypothetical protein